MSSVPLVNPPRYSLAPRADDLAPLAALWIASWQATLPAIDFAARREWLCDHIHAVERRGGETLCAYDRDGALSGFILLDVPAAVLEQIAITPKLFGSGLGAFLLDAAKVRCEKGLNLDVNADNPRALRFYEKHGFIRLSQGVNPHSGLPVWHMRWPGL
jgi:putative acetyltransferase